MYNLVTKHGQECYITHLEYKHNLLHYYYGYGVCISNAELSGHTVTDNSGPSIPFYSS